MRRVIQFRGHHHQAARLEPGTSARWPRPRVQFNQPSGHGTPGAAGGRGLQPARQRPGSGRGHCLGPDGAGRSWAELGGARPDRSRPRSHPSAAHRAFQTHSRATMAPLAPPDRAEPSLLSPCRRHPTGIQRVPGRARRPEPSEPRPRKARGAGIPPAPHTTPGCQHGARRALVWRDHRVVRPSVRPMPNNTMPKLKKRRPAAFEFFRS